MKQSRPTGHEAVPAGIYSVITLGAFPLKLSREKNLPRKPKLSQWGVGVGGGGRTQIP